MIKHTYKFFNFYINISFYHSIGSDYWTYTMIKYLLVNMVKIINMEDQKMRLENGKYILTMK